MKELGGVLSKVWDSESFEEMRPNDMITVFEIGTPVVVRSHGHRYSNRSGRVIEIEIGNAGNRYGVDIDHQTVWFEEEELRRRR